jgi:glycosyltransferase involved in cell wall biosynthesis
MPTTLDQYSPGSLAAKASGPALDYRHPRLSIVAAGHSAAALDTLLTAIFAQDRLRDFEIIVCDDASSDGAWDVTNRYLKDYPAAITASRNCFPAGPASNEQKADLLCRGKYTLHIADGEKFDAEQVAWQLERMEAGKPTGLPALSPTANTNVFIPPPALFAAPDADDKAIGQPPLVSICIHNFNYGRYLRQCLESVFAQTYPNIEICFSDNASSDDSWEIANELAQRHPGQVHLTRNRLNYGPGPNFWNCRLHVRGKYVVKLCSDDALLPEFVARCVAGLETNPTAALAMVHREIIDDDGQRTTEPSFYDRSCLIPGTGQAAVYMMSAINPSISQVMYHVSKSTGKSMTGNLNDRWHGDRLLDFHLCAEADIVYVKDALLLNRVHLASDGHAIDNNLLQCLTQYVLAHQFSDIAAHYGNMPEAVARLPAAIDKIGQLCVRYSLRFLQKGDLACARRYFHLAQAIFPGIATQDQFQLLERYWTASEAKRPEILADICEQPNLVSRTVSYPPPPGSRML